MDISTNIIDKLFNNLSITKIVVTESNKDHRFTITKSNVIHNLGLIESKYNDYYCISSTMLGYDNHIFLYMSYFRNKYKVYYKNEDRYEDVKIII